MATKAIEALKKAAKEVEEYATPLDMAKRVQLYQVVLFLDNVASQLALDTDKKDK